MRPLSDSYPKPLLRVGGKPLVVWQIERLVTAGFSDLIVNVSHLGDQLEAKLGDGSAFGAAIRYSRESEPLEVAGGIATALPLLANAVVLIVSADVYTEFDYAALLPRLRGMSARDDPPHVHLVMVPNPAYHPDGDFVLRGDSLALDGGPTATYANIGLYRTALFRDLPRNRKLRILPLYRDWIRSGWASGELFRGRWSNVGTPDELHQLDVTLSAEQHIQGQR